MPTVLAAERICGISTASVLILQVSPLTPTFAGQLEEYRLSPPAASDPGRSPRLGLDRVGAAATRCVRMHVLREPIAVLFSEQ
jgi:hypothetical protein